MANPRPNLTPSPSPDPSPDPTPDPTPDPNPDPNPNPSPTPTLARSASMRACAPAPSLTPSWSMRSQCVRSDVLMWRSNACTCCGRRRALPLRPPLILTPPPPLTRSDPLRQDIRPSLFGPHYSPLTTHRLPRTAYHSVRSAYDLQLYQLRTGGQLRADARHRIRAGRNATV